MLGPGAKSHPAPGSTGPGAWPSAGPWQRTKHWNTARGRCGSPHRSVDLGYLLNSRNAGATVQAVGDAGSAGVRKGNAAVRSLEEQLRVRPGWTGRLSSPLRTSFLRKWLGTQYFSASLRTWQENRAKQGKVLELEEEGKVRVWIWVLPSFTPTSAAVDTLGEWGEAAGAAEGLLGPCSQAAKEETSLGADRIPGQEANFTPWWKARTLPHLTRLLESRKPPTRRYSFNNHNGKKKVSLEVKLVNQHRWAGEGHVIPQSR